VFRFGVINVTTMTNKSKTTQTAAAAYAANQTEAQDLLNRIAAQLEQHAAEQAKRTADWGFAGSLGYVNDQLAQILAFLGDRSAVDAKGIRY
jgi:hypothetical protein